MVTTYKDTLTGQKTDTTYKYDDKITITCTYTNHNAVVLLNYTNKRCLHLQ